MNEPQNSRQRVPLLGQVEGTLGRTVSRRDESSTGSDRRRKVVGRKGESKTAVEKRLERKMKEAQSSGEVKTVGDLLNEWMADGMPGTKSKSPSTKVGLRSHAESHILPVFGDTALSNIDVRDIQDFLKARVDTHAKSTLIKLRGILSQSFRYGMARRYIDWNPAQVALLPQGAGQKRESRALSEDELELFLKAASDSRLAAWPVVASRLCRRPGEVSGLLWDACDFDAGTITVKRTLLRGPQVKEGTKTGRTGTFTMPDDVVAALKAHKAAQEEERNLMGANWPDEWSDLVFVSEAGTPLNDSNMRRLFDQWTAAAGIEGSVVPKDLRTTGLTILADRGATRDQLADLALHTGTAIVDQHYVKREQVVSGAASLWNN